MGSPAPATAAAPLLPADLTMLLHAAEEGLARAKSLLAHGELLIAAQDFDDAGGSLRDLGRALAQQHRRAEKARSAA